MRYFMKWNPAAPLKVGDKLIQFDTCDYHAGMWRGVFKDEDSLIPEIHIYNEATNRSGAAIEISREDYLKILEKKRPSPTAYQGAQAVGFNESHKPKVADTAGGSGTEDKSRLVESVNPSKVAEVSTLENPSEQSVVTNYKALSEATGISEDELRAHVKRDDSPGRSTKGYNVKAWREYLAQNR